MLGTVSELSTYLGVSGTVDASVTAKLTLALTLSQGLIEGYIGYPLEGSQQFYFDGTGTNTLWSPAIPIESVSSAAYLEDEEAGTWTAYEVTKIRIKQATGEIRHIDDVFPEGFQNIRMTIAFGYSNDLEETDFLYSKFQTLKFPLYETAALLFNNPGVLHLSQLDDGVARQRFDFASASTFIHMLSPESLSSLHTFVLRGSAR